MKSKKLTLKFFTLFLFLACFGGFWGCSSYTSLQSSRDVSIRPHPFGRIMVEAKGLTPADDLKLEWAIKEFFMKQGNITVYTYTDLFPNGEGSLAQRDQQLASYRIDGTLHIHFMDRSVDKNYHPPVTTTDIKRDEKGKVISSTTQTTDEYVTTTIHDFHEMTLIDLRSNKPAWVASANTTGGYEVEKSLSKKIWNQLLKEGWVTKKQPSK